MVVYPFWNVSTSATSHPQVLYLLMEHLEQVNTAMLKTNATASAMIMICVRHIYFLIPNHFNSNQVFVRYIYLRTLNHLDSNDVFDQYFYFHILFDTSIYRFQDISLQTRYFPCLIHSFEISKASD